MIMSSIYNNVLYIYDNVLYISFKKTILKEVEGDILKHTRKPVAVNLDDYIREAIPIPKYLPPTGSSRATPLIPRERGPDD